MRFATALASLLFLVTGLAAPIPDEPIQEGPDAPVMAPCGDFFTCVQNCELSLATNPAYCRFQCQAWLWGC
ncbi:hypothetical protein BGZ63DRAFT_397049 [Mariannaea sp. PMI_226]|nr:hypothetical protein BGZ63DRAFT_397049 [Mariannaea sp. PMI_226]